MSTTQGTAPSGCRHIVTTTRRSGSPWGSGKSNEHRGCRNRPLENGYCRRHQAEYEATVRQRERDLELMARHEGRAGATR